MFPSISYEWHNFKRLLFFSLLSDSCIYLFYFLLFWRWWSSYSRHPDHGQNKIEKKSARLRIRIAFRLSKRPLNHFYFLFLCNFVSIFFFFHLCFVSHPWEEDQTFDNPFFPTGYYFIYLFILYISVSLQDYMSISHIQKNYNTY